MGPRQVRDDVAVAVDLALVALEEDSTLVAHDAPCALGPDHRRVLVNADRHLAGKQVVDYALDELGAALFGAVEVGEGAHWGGEAQGRDAGHLIVGQAGHVSVQYSETAAGARDDGAAPVGAFKRLPGLRLVEGLGKV